jgi:kynurenine formamidase
MRLIDLSQTLNNSPGRPPALTYFDHSTVARERADQYGIDIEDMPSSEGHLAWERITVGTHGGSTHVDAPWHFGPTCEGKPARTIEQLPLEWFYGDGVVFDVHEWPHNHTVTADELQQELKRIGYTLKPFDIVLLRTGSDAHPEQGEASNPGLGREAVLWLVDQGVKVIGIDAPSLDISASVMAAALKRGDKTSYFPAHYAGREREFCIVEKLANLRALPPFGFKVALFPVKMQQASAGWCRAVAFLD